MRSIIFSIVFVTCVVNASDIQPMSLNGQRNLSNIKGGYYEDNLKEYVAQLNDADNKRLDNEQTIIQRGSMDMNSQGQLLIKKTVKITASSVFGIAAIHFIFQNRHKMPSKNQIQNKAFSIATSIKGKGHIGIAYFIACIACCEICGISSSPLEISGGFVYGIRNGFAINAIGKVGGAFIAYCIGRTFLAERVRSKFLSSSNAATGGEVSKSKQIFQLVQTCVDEEPFITALMMRFSFFPHIIKNLLLSIMKPIHWKLFLLVTAMHILPFTFLFTCLGYDSAQHLLDPDLKINYILSGFLVAFTIYSFVVPPGVVALWYGKNSKKLKYKIPHN